MQCSELKEVMEAQQFLHSEEKPCTVVNIILRRFNTNKRLSKYFDKVNK